MFILKLFQFKQDWWEQAFDRTNVTNEVIVNKHDFRSFLQLISLHISGWGPDVKFWVSPSNGVNMYET